MRAASFVVYTIRCHFKKKKKGKTHGDLQIPKTASLYGVRKIIPVISYCFVVDVELVLFERGKQQ